MKLTGGTRESGESPVDAYPASEGSMTFRFPPNVKKIEADKVTDQTGTGPWWNGRVLFISNSEVVNVPARCKATTIYGAASRMVRTAKSGLPRHGRRVGKDKRIHTIILETVERARS